MKKKKKDDHVAIGIIKIRGFRLLIVVQKDTQTHRSITYKNSLLQEKKRFLFFLPFFIIFILKKSVE
jgi:hypothetical protein